MAFTSVSFLGLVAGALLLYYLLPGKCQWPVLLVASAAFYLTGGLGALCYLLFTLLTTYIAGLLLGALAKQRRELPKAVKKQAELKIKRRKRAVAAGALIVNFGLLYVIKYWNFSVQVVADVSGNLLTLPYLDLLFPLGLSFYIFQSAGYVIDCYREKYPPESNLAKYALFVSFFPQMVQGPISRFDHLGCQLVAPHPFDADQLKYGIQLAMWGYFKKLIIADRAAVLVNTVFDTPDRYGGSITAIAVVFYSIQLYCDFSGGIDITRGVAEMFGIDLVENFCRPIFATSLTDYWRRWHITLGAWMKDYVFYPICLSKPFGKLGKFTRNKIGGKLGKIIPTSLATFIVYFIIGIWHGANFRYVVFGLWNGILITSSLLLANQFLRLQEKMQIPNDSKWFYVFRVLRTTGLVLVGRYITRAPRLIVALQMLKKTFFSPCLYQLQEFEFLHLGLGVGDLTVVAVGCALLFTVELFQERGVHIRKTMESAPAFVQWLGIIIPLVSLLIFGILRDPVISAEFIYKQF